MTEVSTTATTDAKRLQDAKIFYFNLEFCPSQGHRVKILNGAFFGNLSLLAAECKVKISNLLRPYPAHEKMFVIILPA